MDFGVPIETHGKRGIRIAQAQNLSEAARIGLGVAAWKVHSQVREALTAVLIGEERSQLLRAQNSLLTTQVQLLQPRLVAGEIPRPDVDAARVVLLNSQIAARQAEGQIATTRASLAAAIGVPVAALGNVRLSWPGFQDPPAPESFSPQQMQREAVVDRLDVRAALVRYAAAEQALRLEIARQFPDFMIGPGYQLEERDNFFTVGFSTVLPVFNRNQGPIAEAEAARKKAAADFLAVQAQGIAQSEAALAAYRSPFAELDQAKNALVALQTQRATMRRRAVALGESDLLALATQPIGPGVDALEFDAKTGLIYVSTGGGEGALSIFHQDSADKYSLVQNVKTMPGARTMALDHKTGTVYLPVADVGETPAPTPENPRPRPRMVPGSFSVLVVGK